MKKNTLIPAPLLQFEDPESRTRVTRLTNFKCHSFHLYFTESGWWDGGSQLVFLSDRGGATNFYSYHQGDKTVRQLSDSRADAVFAHPTAALNPVREEMYFFRDGHLIALDLRSTEERVLAAIPQGVSPGLPTCTADGRHVVLGFVELLPGAKATSPLQKIYQTHRSRWEGRPLSRLLLLPVDGGPMEILLEEQAWLAHPNPSPVHPNLILYCHEGPWALVDNRMWIHDRATGKSHPLRPRAAQGERIGHEFWHADGETIGFHGSRAGQPERKIIGQIRHDNTGLKEDDFLNKPAPGHTHTNRGHLVVGDGGTCLRLWRWEGNTLSPSRLLCRHHASTHAQVLHVHPRFSEDDRQVVFTSSAGGYGNVYLAEVPDFDSLPPDPEAG